MGCVATKEHVKHFNIKLPDQINQTTVHTDFDLSDSQDQFLQIGMNVNGLGEFNPKVSEVYEQLGELFPDLEGQYMLMPDHSIYYGEVFNSKRHGRGKQHWQREGNYLEGTWVDNQLNGRARMIYPNGDYFDGNFANNIANGFGKFCNSRKEVSGFWINNKLTGDGTETRRNGTVYNGQFYDGKIQGQGNFNFANGCVYQGAVSKGKMHGNGEIIFPDKSKYIGEFKSNCIQGRGVYESNTKIQGWFHSKYENSILFIYFFRQETPVLIDAQDCTLIQKQLDQFFD